MRRVDARKVWILWPLTLAYDLDYFLGIHRTATNVFTLLPFLAVLVWAWRGGKRGLVEWMAIALVYLTSHLVMDTFTGGTVLFYPVSTHTYCYLVQIMVHTPTNTLYPTVEDCSHPGVPGVMRDYPWLSATDAATLAFILPAGLAMGAWHAWRYWGKSARREP